MELRSTPIYESYWVLPNRFRAGECPGSLDEEDARKKLRWLLAININLILDLTEPGELGLLPFADLFTYEGACLSRQVIHKRLAIKDFNRPSVARMVEILDTIDLAIAEDKNIYLHCYGGKGRTGTVVGCYLVRHGMLGENALEKIMELRSDIPGKMELSPETEGQRRMVLEWAMNQ